MAHVPGSFSWFECATTDVDAARSFYTKLFGWKAAEAPMPGDMGTYTLLKVGDVDIAGMYSLNNPQFKGIPPHWMSYVTVADADAAAAKAESLGAQVLQAPIDIPNVGRMAFLADPTGAHISIFQLGEHTGCDTSVTNLGWCELHTNDTAAAKKFYTELFPWEAKADPSGHYTEFQLAGRSIAGMMAIPEGQHYPPNWMLYAMVDDCDAALAKVTELGGNVMVPAQDVPNVGRFGVIADPTGAVMAVIKLTGTHSA